MNNLEFISQLADSFAWPVAVLIVALVLRKHIGDLLASLTRLRFGDLELDFQRLARSAVKLPPPSPPSAKVAPRNEAIYSTLQDQMLGIASQAPSASILLAWASVETAMSSAVARLSISPDAPSRRPALHNLEQLGRHTELPQGVAHTINEMRILRNKVTHDKKQQLRISSDSALSYAETAVRIIDLLNSL